MTRKARRWATTALAVVVVLVLVNVLGTVLLPFALGFAIAAFLSPAADTLQRRGWSRGLAAALLTVLALGALGLYTALVVPPFMMELGLLLQRLPALVMAARDHLVDIAPPLSQAMDGQAPSIEAAGQGFDIQGTLSQVLTYGLNLVDLAVVLALTPFLLFYFLRDWPELTETLIRLVPMDQQPVARRLGRRARRRLDEFLTGQGFVCLILAHVYAVALALMKVDFGLVLGVLSGLLVMIPVIGIVAMCLVTCLVAVLQFTSFAALLPVLALYVMVELANRFVLVPRLVAGDHRTHPAWLILAFLVSLQFFGFFAAVLLMPLVCVVEVLAEHVAQQWKRGQLGQPQPVTVAGTVTISGSVLQTPVLGPRITPSSAENSQTSDLGGLSHPPKG
ncbi:AI-2E family transporter [Zavarzinia sp. CC-PAN008]|uniref:AI-2E family transporter n=1 Tax=Zavarzinia sp. CC-PAN008 TaxID=3243332 RepID=UPI003F743625